MGAINAAEFNLRTVDGLGRPLADVTVEVHCVADAKEVTSFRLTSDQDGMVHGQYDPGICSPRGASVGKAGYGGYFSGFRGQYVLKRRFDTEEIRRVAELASDEQEQGLREMLAGDTSAESDKFRGAMFYSEARIHASLGNLVRDPLVTLAARDILVTIADPADLRSIVLLDTPPSATQVLPERWRYAVATALTDPQDENEWAFLRRCALNDFNDRWVDAGAIQTLKVIASARSESILVEVQNANKARSESVTKALEYIRSRPPALSGPDLEDVGKRAAQVVVVGHWESNGAPKFTEAGDKALIDFHFQSGVDALVYTATFHRVGGTWIFRGAHETLQAFSAAGLSRPN